ncbi:MAG: nucleoside triphosphate pyrophosphohydrolase [Candidatus Thermoplasmatota archaeon]
MARLLVATDLTSLAQRAIAHRLAETACAHGHEALVVTDAPLAACKEADAVIALIDGSDPGGMPVAVAATAHALGLPTLALHTHALPDALASLFTQANAVTREEDLAAALPGFYAIVRPFAGKLVRDQVPRLVREAGHQVQFREASLDERPRYLKRKVADEAAELLAADPGQEREEVADLLEALESLLRVRGYDRDDLKLVKEAKRKRRGGFERFLIVESATSVTAPPPEPAANAWPAEEPRLIRGRAPAPTPEPEPEPDAISEVPPFPEPEPETVEAPEADFQMPTAFLDAEPQAAAPEPEVALPSWMSTPPIAAAPTHAPQAYTYDAPARSEPTRTYEAPAPIFQPPAIPSFRIQTPPPAPHNRAKLWNLGAKGEKQEVPEVYDDPDRIDPKVRDI